MSVAEEVLVIGYGNPLRGDDGAGWRGAELLAEDHRAAGARVLALHQLTPELAEDVSQAGLVVLIDASEEPGPAGAVSSQALAHDPVSGSVLSHHVDPARLLQLATALFGQVPPAVQVTITAADVEPGTELSAPVGAAMPELVDRVIDVINQHRQASA
ncbi:MAG: hydrogenase maturation protease [Acidimicrobiales bacterium]